MDMIALIMRVIKRIKKLYKNNQKSHFVILRLDKGLRIALKDWEIHKSRREMLDSKISKFITNKIILNPSKMIKKQTLFTSSTHK